MIMGYQKILFGKGVGKQSTGGCFSSNEDSLGTTYVAQASCDWLAVIDETDDARN